MNEFETIFKFAGTGMAIVDFDGNILNVNNALCSFLKYKEDDLINKNFVDITHPEDVQKDLDKFKKLLNGEIDNYKIEKRYKTSEGYSWGYLTVAHPEGKNYVIAEVQDIDQLKEKQKFISKLVNTIDEVFWVCDSEFNVKYCSPAYERIWGKPVSFIYENPYDWIDCIVESQREYVAQVFLSAFTAKEFDVKYQITRPDGTIRWIHDKGRVYGDKIIGVAHDITLQQNVQKELQSFAYAASHDLREPLRIINGYAYMIQSSSENLPETFQYYVNNMVEAANRMSDMIDGLLTYSRIKQEVELEPICINTAIDKAIKNLQEKIKNSLAVINITGKAKISGIRGQLIQVFQNIIENSIKYKSEKNPKICIKIEKSMDTVLISVKDNGVGIDERQSSSVFQIFKQLHPAGTYEGRGIGMALVKQVIDNHNGQIWFKSIVGKGTTFYISIPLLKG